MSQIKISILKQADPPLKKVLACSFFIMNGGYRDPTFYTKYLKSMIEYKSKNLKGFEFRIYTDDTGKDLVMDLVKDQSHVSVYHYNCEYFRDGDGHTGTFGTIVRFLPLFEEGLDVVWITDIDVESSILDMKILNKMKNYKRDFYVNSFACYDNKPWAMVKYPIVAYKIISFITFPRQIFTRFITRLMNGELEDTIEEINKYNSPRKASNKKFPYGTDELFINGTLYSYVHKHNIPVFITKSYAIDNIVKYGSKDITEKDKEFIDKFSMTPTKDGFERLKKLYKRLIPPMLESNPCLQDVLDNLDHLPAPTKIGWLLQEELLEIKTLS